MSETDPTDRLAPAPPDRPGALQRMNLADMIYERILQQIVDGTYAEGDRLPRELDLCARFGTSRPIVREALARLKADGLISTIQGSGSYVESRPNAMIFSLAPPEGVAGVLRGFELRIALEGEAAFLAALRRTEEDLEMLSRAWRRLETVVTEGTLGLEEDLAFHLAVAAASHNDLFVNTLRTHAEITRKGLNMTRSLSLTKSGDRLRRVQDEHMAILSAITAGDPDRARTAMRHHIDNARARLTSDARQ